MARPNTKYRPELIAQAEKLCRLGATDIEIADFFEVDVPTLYRWKGENEEFCQALKAMSDAENTELLARLADGELLAEIAESIGVKRTTLYMRLQATPALVDAYARAREEGLHARGERLRLLAEENVSRTANGAVDSAAVAQLKLRVDTEKWTLSKLLPKVYGDKMTVAGDPDAPLAPAVPPELVSALAQMPLEKLRALASKPLKDDAAR